MRDTRSMILAVVGLLGVWAVAQAAPNPPGEGVPFNGTSSMATVENGKAFDLDAFTISAWVKLRRTGGSQVFLGRGAAADLFTLYLYNGKVRMLVEHQAGKYTHADAPAPAANVWTHYTGTYDGQKIRLYVDGKLTGETAAGGRMRHATDRLALGALESGDRALDGWLEDVRIYGRALGGEEIEKLQASGAGDKADGGLVARWTSQSLAGRNWRNLAGGELAADYIVDLVPTMSKDDGYRGIWYYNQPQKDEYAYKYSGGLGTYCSSHNPFAIYRPEVNKTFFCYGGSPKDRRTLLHMVSYYDHATGMVPRPTILVDKKTDDAHDNPVISIDDKGFLWIFSSSHGTSRPSYIWVSKKPYDIESFERVLVTNFSYPQVYYMPGQGFLFLHTLYRDGRKLHVSTSLDGRTWTEPVLYAAIDQGHYQVTWSDGKKAASAFNYHPSPGGLNFRTNLYYMETSDFGKSWRTVEGQQVKIPLTTPKNEALVHDYQAEGLKVYVQDVNFDPAGRPVVLYITSRGYESGPQNGPRTWCTAWWNGKDWEIRGSITSDSNYDMGSIYVEGDSLWRIIGPTETGPQAYNPGGEVAMWNSTDRGRTWTKVKQLTSHSKFNHTYCRRPVNAHPDFYALWADGNARQPSESRLYFCNREGQVCMLPPVMTEAMAKPVVVP